MATKTSPHQKRMARVRKALAARGNLRPRLSVFRSSKNIYAQIIDDVAGKTLVAASTKDKELRVDLTHGSNCKAAVRVGQVVARRALEKGIEKVVFDRGGYLYHGRIKSLAESAREAGLKF